MLNIKEIFKSDLDPNSTNWWAKDKIDKLNFNFNQLSDGGMSGPIGPMGSDGANGIRGSQGFIGNQGPHGSQGFVGLSGNTPWRSNKSVVQDTILTNFQGGTEYSAIPMLIGADLLTSQYTDAINWTTDGTIFNSQLGRNNLTLDSPDASRFDFHYQIYGGAGADPEFTEMNIGTKLAAGGLTTKWSTNLADTTINFREDGTSDQPAWFTISDDKIIRPGRTTFQLPVPFPAVPVPPTTTVKVSGDLQFAVNAQPKQVLVSTNTTGTTEWKNTMEVFGALPVGSVVAIRPSDFNNTYFHISDAGSTGATEYLEIIYGRGREGTMYEGWYLANGQTWADGVLEYPTPNLNSFNYKISINPAYEGPEGTIDQANLSPIIIAGADAYVDASLVTTSLYNITSTIDSQDIEITLGTPSGPDYLAIKKDINIVNLGETSLYFQTTAQTITTTSITLSIPESTVADACDASNDTYQWTGGFAVWNNLSEALTGVILYTDVGGSPGVTAPSNKWYHQGGVSRYWNGTVLSQPTACPVIYTDVLYYDTNVSGVNGTGTGLTATSATYEMDTPLFGDATSITLQSNGTAPPAGWYREDGYNLYGNLSYYRRYWNGSSFTGDLIDKKFVQLITQGTELSEINNSSACGDQSTNPSSPTYYGRNTDPALDSGYVSNIVLENIFNGGVADGDTGEVYVHVAWSGSLSPETTPLVKIASINAPGGASPYATILERSPNSPAFALWRSLINSNSTITDPAKCYDYSFTPSDPIYYSTSTPRIGTITVVNAPQSFYLKATSGYGSALRDVSAELTIIGSTVSVFANGSSSYPPNMTVSQEITLSSPGQYGYLIDEVIFGDGSNNQGFIEIQVT